MSGPEWLEQRLGWVTDGLREDPGAWVRAETVQGLVEALRASAGAHQLVAGAAPWTAGGPLPRRECGQWWPCQVVQDVTTILEGLL